MRQLIDAARAALEALVREVGSEPTLYAAQTDRAITALRAALDVVQEQPEPIDMILHCPLCGKQHIDASEPNDAELNRGLTGGWGNPPHRSHLCHGCGHIWRPADVPTNGVAAVKTRGKADSPLASTPPQPVAVPDPTDPCYDVDTLREHVRHLERRVRQLTPPQPVAVPDGTRALIEQCRAALAEELAAWDIDPPLHHVKQAHDWCVAWLAAALAAPAPVQQPVVVPDGVYAALQQASLALEELDGPGYLIGGVMHHRIGLLLPKLNKAMAAIVAAQGEPTC